MTVIYSYVHFVCLKARGLTNQEAIQFQSFLCYVIITI